MYVVEVVLSIAGDQIPVIPSKDVVGKVKVPPEQIAGMGVNVGVAGGPTFTVIVVVAAH